MKSSKDKKTSTTRSKTPIANEAPVQVGQAPLALGLTPPHVEMFMLMMEKYKIDKLEFGGVLKLEKSQHVFPELSKDIPEENQEDVLYHSAN